MLLPDNSFRTFKNLIAPFADVQKTALAAQFTVAMKASDFDRAEEALRRLLKLDPLCAKAWVNLALICYFTFRYEEGIACAEQAKVTARQCSEPKTVRYGHNLKLTILLTLGRWAEAWEAWEASYSLRPVGGILPRTTHYVTENAQMRDKRVLVGLHGGIGDHLMFSRFLPELKAYVGAKSVCYLSPPGTYPLFQKLPVDLVANEQELPECDCWLSVEDFPRVFGVTPDTIRNWRPIMIQPSPEIMARAVETIEGYACGLRLFFGGAVQKKIGIVWCGSHAITHHDQIDAPYPQTERSIPLRLFTELARINGVLLFSLQRSDGLPNDQGSRLQQFGMPETAQFLLVDIEAGGRSIEWTAAAIRSLDLIITIDTSIAHLAGALGKPVWVLLPYCAEWRWLTERTDSPWYPTMRLYRQSKPGDWAEVMQRVAADLRAEMEKATEPGDSAA